MCWYTGILTNPAFTQSLPAPLEEWYWERGLPNKQIAFELGLTEKTVKAYLSMLYRKLGVSSRTQAVILLQELMVEPHMMAPAIQHGVGI